MIPCLYDISETSYVTNGIGKLADCISCIVTEKRNGSYELKMEYPSDGIHAESITEGNIILAKPADRAAPQPFRIYKITTPMDGKLEIAARHISYQLNFITVSPVTVVSGTDDQVVLAYQVLLDNAATECPFSFETDMSSTAYFGILEPTSFRNALGGVDGSLLDTFGGEFEWDMYTVRLLKTRGSDNGVRIVYGKNLVDFKMEKSIEEVITGVHPFWKDSETDEVMELSEKVVTLVDTDYPYEKIVVLDCTEQFEEKPTESSLRSYARSYLESTSYTEPDIDINIDFAQLWQMPGYEDIAEAEQVSLCDTVHVYVSKLDIEVSATVTETKYDTLLERYESITISNAVASSRNTSLNATLSSVADAAAAAFKAAKTNEAKIQILSNSIKLSVTVDEETGYLRLGTGEDGTIKFTVDADNMTFDEDGNLSIAGTINSEDGVIGGWNIASTKIYGTADDKTTVAVMQISGLSDDTAYIFACGESSNGHSSYADCPFRVNKLGNTWVNRLVSATYLVAGNDYGLNCLDKDGDVQRVAYLSTNNNMVFGNESFPTYLYGDGIYINSWRVKEVQHGNVAISVSAADTPTSVEVTFDKEFSGTPDIVLSAATSSPATSFVGVLNPSSTGCTIYLTRTTTGEITVRWMAVY